MRSLAVPLTIALLIVNEVPDEDERPVHPEVGVEVAGKPGSDIVEQAIFLVRIQVQEMRDDNVYPTERGREKQVQHDA